MATETKIIPAMLKVSDTPMEAWDKVYDLTETDDYLVVSNPSEHKRGKYAGKTVTIYVKVEDLK